MPAPASACTDRYSYRYSNGASLDPVDGPSSVVLECVTTGDVPVPAALPSVSWRAGIDLHPLSVLDSEDMHWLETLVWPEQEERRERLRAAIEIAKHDPPHLVAGDARERLAALAAEAPGNATLVVISSGTLVYLPAAERQLFAEAVRELGARWVSLEGRGALPDVEAALPAGGRGRSVLALDERPLAYTGPHGQSLDWFPAAAT